MAATRTARFPNWPRAWAAETFGTAGAKPYVALGGAAAGRGAVRRGESGSRREPGQAPAGPVRRGTAQAAGAPGACRVHRQRRGRRGSRARGSAPWSAPACGDVFWEGSFAGFAAIIAGSRLYVGYDSAGQHVAAACGVPLVSVFAGFPVPRMFHRWRPVGEHCRVIRVDRPDVPEVLEKVREAIGGAGL